MGKRRLQGHLGFLPVGGGGEAHVVLIVKLSHS